MTHLISRPVLTRAACAAFALASLLCAPAAHAQVTSFSGNAFGTSVTTPLVPVSITLAPTGNLPATGGTLTNQVASANVVLTGTPAGALTTGVENASTNGIGQSAFSSASVNNLSFNLGGLVPLTLGANTLTANSLAQCNGVAGSSVITGLTLNGISVLVTGAPNQTLALPGGLGTLIINEQVTNFSPTRNEITVNALDLTLFGGGRLIVASANSDVTCINGAVNGTLVPEPSQTAAFGLGLLGLSGLMLKARKRKTVRA